MSTKIKSNILNRMEKMSRPKQLYIVPTLDGIKLLALNFILLVIGLLYANNFVLLFNFILFCLFLGSMFYTHFNLQGLRLISAKMSPLHVNGHGIMTLSFQSSSAIGHHFLSAKFKNKLVQLENNVFSVDTKTPKSLDVNIQISGINRGYFILSKLYLETLFPLHLFRCFVYFNPDLAVHVYPEKVDYKLHKVSTVFKDTKEDGDDFELSEFQPGDPIKRIHWKKLAQTNRWYSKKTISPITLPVILSLQNNFSKLDLEKQLCSICYNLYELHFQNIPYGLSIGNLNIKPECSIPHLNRCLRSLAEYEN